MPTVRGYHKAYHRFSQKEWKCRKYCERKEIHPEDKAEVQLKQKTLYLTNRLRGMRVAGYVRVEHQLID